MTMPSLTFTTPSEQKKFSLRQRRSLNLDEEYANGLKQPDAEPNTEDDTPK